MLWFIAESGKLKKTKIQHNLIRVGAWRAQVHWVDQAWRVFCCSCISIIFSSGLFTAWRVFCCSCIPTTFFCGLFTAWRAAERFYAEGFGFLFDNTPLCCPCVCISLPLSLPFIFYCGCDFNWLRLFINSIYSLCSFSAHFVFVIKLELVIFDLGV